MKALSMREIEEKQKSIPPLSQSRYGDMACETLYVCKDVQCVKVGESEPSARGIEIHQVLATYINHLVRTRRATDLEVFDALMKGVSDEAREVLETFRANHAFDPEKILATELHIALDENVLPIEHPDDEAQIAEFEGTLDLVMIHSFTEAEIDDWKSYYQVIDADTFQSKFYPLLLMCLNPSLESVKFVLEFVRYGASRSVEYTRKDLPWLKELAQSQPGHALQRTAQARYAGPPASARLSVSLEAHRENAGRHRVCKHQYGRARKMRGNSISRKSSLASSLFVRVMWIQRRTAS